MTADPSLLQIEDLVRGALEQRRVEHDERTFEELGLDSFDLIELRTLLEQAVGGISDAAWGGVRCPRDLRALVASRALVAARAGPAHAPAPGGSAARRAASPISPPQHTPDADRHVRLNMPSMAIGGLSEGWLFRELGDLHWAKLCDHLGQPSHAIIDEQGARLYATFVRVRWQANASLRAWRENDELSLSASLSRLGRSVVVNHCSALGWGKAIEADLMTTFAARGEGNQNLRKTTPATIEDADLPVLSERPAFASEYHQMRNGELHELRLGGLTIAQPDAVLHEQAHAINPYYEINGVNLLYFASYPLISDQAERAVINAHPEAFAVDGDWAVSHATVARDVFYFNNCDLDDSIIYQMNHWRPLDGGRVALVSTLRRASDGERLARVVAIKERCDG